MATKNLLDNLGDLDFARGTWYALASTGTRTGRYSDLIDLSALKYPMLEVHMRLKANGTPTANRGAYLFWINHDQHASDVMADDAATWDANNMPAAASIVQLQSQFIGSLWTGTSVSSNQVIGPGTFRFPHPGGKGAFLLFHDIGVALSSDDQDCVNGTFASDTVWTKGTGWSIGSGKATKSAGSASLLSQSCLIDNCWYRVQYTISSFTAGTLTLAHGGTLQPRSADGTYTEDIFSDPGAVGGFLAFSADSSFAGSLDDVTAVCMSPLAYNEIRYRGVNPQLV